MKPINTFVFFIMIAAGVILLSIFFPKEGVVVYPGVDLRFLSFHELPISDPALFTIGKEKSIASNLHQIDSIECEQGLPEEKEDSIMPLVSSVEKVLPEVSKPLVVHRKRIRTGGIPEIMLPEGNQACLDIFFENLYRASNTEACSRILFIGDSQIEGDHISGTVRENLQQRFNGEGVGFVPIKEVYNKKYGLIQKVSDNWKEYSIISKHKVEDRKFGVSGSYYKLNIAQGERADGWIKFRKFKADSMARPDYKILNLYYSNPGNDTAFVEVLWKGKLIKKKKLVSGQELESLKYGFNFSPGEIELHFKAGNSLRLYGLSLECNRGVIVDNLPHRGCATPGLCKTDLQFYRSMLKKMKVKMAIFQFGANVVPYAGTNPKFYEDRLYRDLKDFHDVAPDIPVLVVGVSDLAKKVGTRMESWSNIHAVKEAQIRATRRAGCAFWDLEAAMGGQNSMVSWVNSTPSLGKKDYIHFTKEGAEKVGKMLSDAILESYQVFEDRKILSAQENLAQN